MSGMATSGAGEPPGGIGMADDTRAEDNARLVEAARSGSEEWRLHPPRPTGQVPPLRVGEGHGVRSGVTYLLSVS